MNTRKTFFFINLSVLLVLVAAAVVGLVLGTRAIEETPRTMDVAELAQVQHELAFTKETTADIVSLSNSLPEGYGLLWVDATGSVFHKSRIEDRIAARLLKSIGPSTVDGVYTDAGINVAVHLFVSNGKTSTILMAVDARGAYLDRLNNMLLIYGLCLGGLMLIAFLLCSILESAVIYPRLTELRHAMNEVYNGNYAQVVRIPRRQRINDITQLLVEFDRLRRRIADATKAKEDADRERGVMISGISHDLRTPLTVIQVHAKGLVDGVAQRMGKTEQYYDNIYSTACSMLSLVDKLAEFSKVETHTVTYSFVDRDLGVVLQEYVNNHYIPYAARGLKFKLKLPKGKPLMVSLDKEQFLRVLQNICDNSLKYKDKEVCTMVISGEISGDEVILRLADDGPGIGDFEAEYIFESYYRGDPSRTNPISGSGLGLSIVKSIILAHRGQIVAYNNNGLTIEITLPYRRKK